MLEKKSLKELALDALPRSEQADAFACALGELEQQVQLQRAAKSSVKLAEPKKDGNGA